MCCNSVSACQSRFVRANGAHAFSVNHSFLHRLRKVGKPESPQATLAIPKWISWNCPFAGQFQKLPWLNGQELRCDQRIYKSLRSPPAIAF